MPEGSPPEPASASLSPPSPDPEDPRIKSRMTTHFTSKGDTLGRGCVWLSSGSARCVGVHQPPVHRSAGLRLHPAHGFFISAPSPALPTPRSLPTRGCGLRQWLQFLIVFLPMPPPPNNLFPLRCLAPSLAAPCAWGGPGFR